MAQLDLNWTTTLKFEDKEISEEEQDSTVGFMTMHEILGLIGLRPSELSPEEAPRGYTMDKPFKVKYNHGIAN